MQASPLLERHRARGARLGPRPEAPECATAHDFSPPADERRAAEEGCVVFDQSDRGEVTVHGSDGPAFLHRLLANEVRDLRPGSGNRNLLLTAKGRVRFDLELARGESVLRLDVGPGQAGALLAALDQYLFSEDVRLEDTSQAHAPLDLLGPRAEGVLREVLGAEVHPGTLGEREHLRTPDGLRVTRLPVAGRPGFRLDPGAEACGRVYDALLAAGTTPAGTRLRDALRIEAGSALFGVEIDETVYPQEVRLEEGFSLSKGCYVGQEVVAKLDTYGGLNKRTALLRWRGSPPETGDELRAEPEGRPLGRVGGVAVGVQPEEGWALGLIKLEHQDPGTELLRADGAGSVSVVPFPDSVPAAPADPAAS